jgi:PAS domain-containing protein
MSTAPPDLSQAPEQRIAQLEEELRKLRKINATLIDRVERSSDLSHSAFSMFERAITLEQLVRDRTRALEQAMGELATVNAKLAQAHATAEAAQIRLRDAIESINEGFALFDAEDRLVLYNEAYTGFWPEVAELLPENPTFHEIISLVAQQRRPAGALSAPDRWVSDRLARHAVASGGHVQALSDGRWIQINELRTSEGGIVGIYTDITEAKAEDARARARDLAEQNLALQALLDNLVEGVCMFDADRRLTAWNGRCNACSAWPETPAPRWASTRTWCASARRTWRWTGLMCWPGAPRPKAPCATACARWASASGKCARPPPRWAAWSWVSSM